MQMSALRAYRGGNPPDRVDHIELREPATRREGYVLRGLCGEVYGRHYHVLCGGGESRTCRAVARSEEVSI